jgi:hypothetical protein
MYCTVLLQCVIQWSFKSQKTLHKHKNEKYTTKQQNSDEQFSMNSVFYCYEIKMSVNQHLNSSLSEAEEQRSVRTGNLKTTTVSAHTRAHMHTHTHTHTHRYLLTRIMPSINTAVTHNTYICNPWTGRDSNLENPKFQFETDNCATVSAPKSDVSLLQTAHKTQQMMRSTIRRLVTDYTV